MTTPDTDQEQVVEQLREYIAQWRDEANWESVVRKSQPQLVAAARRARQLPSPLN